MCGVSTLSSVIVMALKHSLSFMSTSSSFQIQLYQTNFDKYSRFSQQGNVPLGEGPGLILAGTMQSEHSLDCYSLYPTFTKAI